MTKKIAFLGLFVTMLIFPGAVTTASPAPAATVSPLSPTIAAYAADTNGADTDQAKPKKKCCCKDAEE